MKFSPRVGALSSVEKKIFTSELECGRPRYGLTGGSALNNVLSLSLSLRDLSVNYSERRVSGSARQTHSERTGYGLVCTAR